MLVSKLYAVQYELRQHLTGWWWAIRHGKQPACEMDLAPNRVLFILTGLLGDSVMCTPAIAAARHLWPESKISLLGKRHNLELLAACPHIDEFIETTAIPFTLTKRKDVSVLAAKLRALHFDLAIILLGDQFAHLLAKVGIPIRVGVKEHPLAPCLTHHYSIGSPRTWGAEERLGALRCLGYKVESVKPRLWVDRDARESASLKLRSFGVEAGERYVVLHPFGSEKRQWWPLNRAALLAEAMFHELGLKTLLIGGPEVRSAINQNLPACLLDSTGRLSVRELLAVIERAELVVTTDSGPFHIAGALERPAIGLFRGRRPEHAAAYPTAKVVFGHNAECDTKCDWDRCRGVPCRQMQSITVEEVLKVIRYEGSSKNSFL